MNSNIDRFDGEFSFLSNFYPSPVEYAWVKYPTVEHAFQAAKTEDLIERGGILMANSPGRAKRIGRTVTLRSDWESVKVSVMLGLLRQKFASGSELGDRLKSTYPAQLIEGNTWGDVYWGVCRGQGMNKLGLLLMKVRNEL